MTNTAKITAGVLTGALVGVSIGLLFAPNKGVRTRAMIADKAKKAADATTATYGKAASMLGLNKKPLEREKV
jgi:gas vesicle protein